MKDGEATVVLKADLARVTALTVKGSPRAQSHWEAALQPAAAITPGGGSGSTKYTTGDVHHAGSDVGSRDGGVTNRMDRW